MPTKHSRGTFSRIPRRNRNSDNDPNNSSLDPSAAADGSSERRTPRSGKFENIPSISRSSGLERDGDTLKDPGVQEEYREFLQEKLDAYWKIYAPPSSSTESNVKKLELESNILIQFRKLREGISSSQRRDLFAIEVYETSLWLSIIFRSRSQTTSILSHLLPDIYLSVTPFPKEFSCLTILLASLHSLDLYFPSQRSFFDLEKGLPPPLALGSDHKVWLRELSCSLRRGGYLQFRRLTQHSSLARLAAAASETPDRLSCRSGPDLPLLSFEMLIASLRSHLRLSTWRMIRSAYREFALPLSNTEVWLSDMLLLETERGKEEEEDPRDSDHVQVWFISRENLGEVGRKEGSDRRWVVKTKK
ncbi:hypothetical protein B0F90DRAFT_1233749 [Multifurca ochricompacta]|uniref:Uncharacterized protein n=1 Tax=Multifurca ochricompacta TaxID=376703 RepID=A0AAD4QQ48_9AGAM|nr:hypothetical protein B0F90DRAFT_1233749 [Multifurca ochricompacta]